MLREALTPEAIARLDSLELRASRIVEGLSAGAQRSPLRGVSIEFAEHRQYTPGDDLRYVDWKVFGKTDRFFLKQFHAETNYCCQLLVDLTESMAYQGPASPMTKAEYAKCLAAAIGYLVLRQQDGVGLSVLREDQRPLLETSNAARQFRAVCNQLAPLTPAGEYSVARSLHQLSRQLKRRSLVVVVSDLFDDPGQIIEGLRHLVHCRHEVIVLQVLDAAERDFPFREPTRFVGLESWSPQLVDARLLKQAYQAEFAKTSELLSNACLSLGIELHQLSTSTRFDLALYQILGRRGKRLR